ncbi:MAG: AGE family epimerase/isomerase [Planctomycetota bacterium]|nr:AGE family epimerase/isomerase [Planctomycetota bacterium]
MTQMNFTFSDLIAGYVRQFDFDKGLITLRTSDDREFQALLTATTFAEVVRNLGEPFMDCTAQMKDMLLPGRFVYAYGVFFPEQDKPFEAKHLVFLGRSEGEFRFEKQDWWIKQVTQLGNFYLNAQFGDGEIDYRNYRTVLGASGEKESSTRQETDTISRLVYGFASAYMLTGNDRFLEAAEKGTQYLRDHFRALDTAEDTCYWYHAIETKGSKERKILASEFGDDYDAIPAYEQIYALAGPVQTFRVTGDKQILEDARRTVNFLDRYFLDREKGGYFSHIDPVTFDPCSMTIPRDRARKNWNSVGDHAPAYLINLYLATREKRYADMLVATADTIAAHFPDYENSPFVQEKFHEDWSKDQQWGWQQNRAVVGHNLKIAWNLMRINSLTEKKGYVELAKQIAELMPKHGGDPQRGGWYDVVERVLGPGERHHRFAWHDRKAWWQQEQGILAYLILHGILKDPAYLKHARESSAFYSAWFLDHDAGGIYFNVLANGLPYMLGTEREKGSHSMSGYHSFELCYLGAAYTNLLITKEPMDFHFKPMPNSFKDNVLYVAPDILPKGSIRIESVTVNGEPYRDFDAAALTVKLPSTNERVKVKVTIAPTSGVEHFSMTVKSEGGLVKLALAGELDSRAVPQLRKELAKLLNVKRLALIMDKLTLLSPEGARLLVFAKQKMDVAEDLFVVGAKGQPREVLERDEFCEEVTMLKTEAELKKA